MRLRCHAWRCVRITAMVAAVAAAGLDTWLDYRPTNHFDVVERGVLYRSGQPDERAWRRILKEYRIRTVVNLRGTVPDAAWFVTESEFCRRHGLRLIHLPISEDGLTDAELATFIGTVTDPRNQPVLVHCECGSSRTGVVAAAYRILVQHWDYETAVAEAEKFRFRPRVNKGYDEFLRRLAAGRAQDDAHPDR